MGPKNGELDTRIIEAEDRILSPTEVYMLAYGYKPKKRLVSQFRQYLDGEWTEWKTFQYNHPIEIE